MKFIKLSLVAALFTTAIYAGNEAPIIATDDFEASANIAFTSDYVWRGMSLTDGDMAIQGGMDLEYKGAYVGVWASNIAQLDGDGLPNSNSTTIETDIYFGYAGDIDKFSYDVGYNQYIYVNLSEDLNFGELYVGVAYDFDVVAVGAKYSFGIKTNEYKATDNVEVTASVPLPWELSFDLAYGMFEDYNDYYYTSISRDFGRFNVNLAYTGRVSASYGDTIWDGTQGNKKSKDFFVATLGASF